MTDLQFVVSLNSWDSFFVSVSITLPSGSESGSDLTETTDPNNPVGSAILYPAARAGTTSFTGWIENTVVSPKSCSGMSHTTRRCFKLNKHTRAGCRCIHNISCKPPFIQLTFHCHFVGRIRLKPTRTWSSSTTYSPRHQPGFRQLGIIDVRSCTATTFNVARDTTTTCASTRVK